MNLSVGSDCFIPSSNTVITIADPVVVFLLSETHESIAVPENKRVATRMIVGSPKPPNPVLLSGIVTYEKIVPLVPVEVCELVDSAFYHIKNYRAETPSRFVISATLSKAFWRRSSKLL